MNVTFYDLLGPREFLIEYIEGFNKIISNSSNILTNGLTQENLCLIILAFIESCIFKNKCNTRNLLNCPSPEGVCFCV